jgi:nucleotide-binding universal stress UspA family protein
MPIKDLVIVMDGMRSVEAAITLAGSIAERYSAHLEVAFLLPPVQTTTSTAGYRSASARAYAAAIRRVHRQVAAVRHAFEAWAETLGIVLRWHTIEADLSGALAMKASCADLAIVRQRSVADAEDSLVDPVEILLASGCPTLVVPLDGHSAKISRHALIAWNASREARRAVQDALPFLKEMADTTVLILGTHEGESTPEDEIEQHLARHGIAARIEHRFVAQDDVAETILSRAAALKSDLIVMGAFGAARVHGSRPGLVTRTVLERMSVPVLLSS